MNIICTSYLLFLLYQLSSSISPLSQFTIFLSLLSFSCPFSFSIMFIHFPNCILISTFPFFGLDPCAQLGISVALSFYFFDSFFFLVLLFLTFTIYYPIHYSCCKPYRYFCFRNNFSSCIFCF